MGLAHSKRFKFHTRNLDEIMDTTQETATENMVLCNNVIVLTTTKENRQIINKLFTSLDNSHSTLL